MIKADSEINSHGDGNHLNRLFLSGSRCAHKHEYQVWDRRSPVASDEFLTRFRYWLVKGGIMNSHRLWN